MKVALLLISTCLAFAEPPPAVTELLRLTTDAMANSDFGEFIKHFDPGMPNYGEFAQRLGALIGADAVASTIEVTRDEGDDNKRKLELNWLLQVGQSRQKRGKVTVTVERKTGTWVFTSLDPVQFFAP